MPNNSLRLIREKKGLTLAQLAGKSSVSIRTLQMYETGERPISADDLRKLSRILLTPTAELMQPSADPPPPPPSPEPVAPSLPSESASPSSPTETTVIPPVAPPLAPPAESVRPNGEARATASAEYVRRPLGPGEPHRSFGGVPSRSAPPRPPRPSREPRVPRPPGPSTKGQLEQIHNLARRMGLDDAEVEERIGVSLSSLNHQEARDAIAKLRQHMEESGTWQPRVGEGIDQEGAYLGKLRDRGISVIARLIDGSTVEGKVVDYTPYAIRLRDDRGEELMVRKLAIAYYQTKGPVDDAQ